MKRKRSSAKKNRIIDLLSEKKSDPFVIQEGKFDYRNLKDSVYYSDWTEDSFLQDPSTKESAGHSFDYSILKYFLIIFVLGFLLIIGRSFWLQIIKGSSYSLLAEGNRLRSVNVEAKRGIIYDYKMRPLVRNSANFVLYLKPIDLPKDELERDSLLRELAFMSSGFLEDKTAGDYKKSAEIDASEEIDLVTDVAAFYKLKEKLSKVVIGSLESYQPLFIADNLDYDTALLIILKSSEWPGVFVSNKTGREYLVPSSENEAGYQILEDSSLSHILGYTGKINEKELKSFGKNYSLIDYVGKTGLEYFYEKELKGIAGRKNVEVDVFGREKKVINESEAIDGYNLRLSIDLDLQLKAEEILKEHLDKRDLKKASFVAIDPRNGSVLSLVSLPSYNNNLFSGGISQKDYDKIIKNPDKPLINRSISGEFPSGSTIKPVFAAGALQEGVVTAKTPFLSTGGLRIGQWFFPDWKAGGHGTVNVKSALAWSVNTFFYYIGGGYGDFEGMNLDGLIKYSKLFGLGEKTGIDLPGESAGLVPSREWKREKVNETWYIGNTYHLSIGQGYLLTTPIQIANFTAAIANGGTLYKPKLLKEMYFGNGDSFKTIKPEVIREGFIDKEKMAVVREGMREAVSYGSARYLSYLPFSSAGKTGTAQWFSVKENHAWYIGFAPYEEPKIAFVILVEEGEEGSSVAVPIAHDILKWYLADEESNLN